ncbi:MAG: hypothetical protein HYW45_03320 [Candidatus Daviesbacteria bacterium]|nr:MAG: hypothetical protein HYW45_03320 [Candidatus Daviesbacteria bacterium]
MLKLDQEPISLEDHLVRVHGPRVKPLLMEFRVEVHILNGLAGYPLTAKEALIQIMTWEKNPNLRQLGQFFDLGRYNPVRYFRDVLTETPGLEELRVDFEKTLVQAAKAEPQNRILQRAKMAWVVD